jgi:hypothetical protein
MRGRSRRRLRFESLEPRIVLDARLLITELVADNEQGLRDEDGDRRDWIELYNAGSSAAALEGWHLTDAADTPGKWTFPDVVLGPHRYLTVFASGKDRADPFGPLHTNFRLQSAGEYVGLFAPDAADATFEYAPRYPALAADVAFGLPQGLAEATPVDAVAPLRVLVPSEANGGSELGTRWTEVEFDDSGWQQGVNGVGYETLYGFEDLIGADVEAGMFQVNASALIRIPFALDDPASLVGLVLRMKYDDGYVAYLNGVEVARRNAPDELLWNSQATATHRDSLAVEFEDVDLSAAVGQLRPGQNVLAIHGLNSSVRSNDFLILPVLATTGPGVVQTLTGRYFATPTPAAPNGEASYGGLIAMPTMSVPRGLYDTPFDVVLTTATPGTRLVYTTDGSAPRVDHGIEILPTSPQIPPQATLHIAQTSVVRVAAFKDDFLPSAIQTRTYIFPDDVATQDFQATLDAGLPDHWEGTLPDYGIDPDVVGPDDLFDGLYTRQFVDSLRAIPSLSMVMDVEDLFGQQGIYSNPEQRGSEWERPTSLELINSDGAAGFQADAGVRIQGVSSRSHAATKKKSFRLSFRREYGPTKLEFPLFGSDAADRFDTIVLRNLYNDGWQWQSAGVRAQYVRDEWLRAAQLAMGQVGSHGTFVHLYINGHYWGIYNAVERPDASFLATYFGGDKDEWDALNTGDPVDGSQAAWQTLLELAKDVATAEPEVSNAAYQRLLGNHPDGTKDPALEPLLDVDNMIDYLLVNFYTGNTDWPTRNWYAGRLRGAESDGFKFFSWDGEWTLNFRSNVATDRTGVSVGAAAVYSQLRGNDEFRLRFADHVQRHFFEGGLFYVDSDNPAADPANPERNMPAALYQRLADQVELALIAESARWGDQHEELPLTVADWRTERDDLLANYFPRRSPIVLDQLVAAGLYPTIVAPVFSQHGGTVPSGTLLTLEGPGEVYFTLDGSDPRAGIAAGFAAANDVSAAAIRYQEPIVLSGPAVVKTRALVAGQWSALNEAHFTLEAPPLRVTEIMYHPQPPAAGSPLEDDDFEFIELQNVSATTTLDLGNVAFSQGVRFTFPRISLAPGEYVVVVRNRAAFADRYGVGILVAGEYGVGFKLDNAGETLRLESPDGLLIQEFAYADDWYPETDGGGFSLELINPSGSDTDRWNMPDAWLPSIQDSGTPGASRASAVGLAGDMNLDGGVDLHDVDPFVLGLSQAAAYQARFGVPATHVGDMDGDGDLDFDDIGPFVQLLSGNAAEADPLESPDSRAATYAGLPMDPLPTDNLFVPYDLNFDGATDSDDLAILQQNYDPLGQNENTYFHGDFDADGQIGKADIALWEQYSDLPLPGSDSPFALFNQFAIDNFGAENEALAYATFGQELAFVAQGTWEHASVNSALIGFESNLPARTYVAFGETLDYGWMTVPSERPFSIHVHYLRDLQPETEYHYRLVAVDERGNILTSEDRAFTTQSLAGKILLATAHLSAPQQLDQAGATYVLTTDVVADSTAFNLTADDITLDLNGHTVTYDNVAGAWDPTTIPGSWAYRGPHGIRVTGEATSIYNGIILQGPGNGGDGSEPLYAHNHREVGGITVAYQGPQLTGIDGSLGNGHHNVVIDYGTEILDRHSGLDAIREYNGSTSLHHNLVKRARHRGLRGADDSEIYRNEVYLDSWAINSFGISNFGGHGLSMHDNRIFGTGYHVVAFSWGDRFTIANNYVHLQGVAPTLRSNEEGWHASVNGMRLTQYGGSTNLYRDNLYEGNVIVVKGREGCQMRGVQFSSDPYVENLIFRRNIVKVIAQDSGTIRASAVVTQGNYDRADEHLPIRYENNTFISNRVNVRFGDYYGVGSNHWFIENTFVKRDDSGRYYTFYFENSYPSTHHIIRDATFEGGASLESVHWVNPTADHEFTVQWNLAIHTTAFTAVTIVDADGQQVFSGSTPASGDLSMPLDAYRARFGGNVRFTPHTVRVEKNGHSASAQVTMDQERRLVLHPSGSFPSGDMNLDGGVDYDDIAPLLLGLNDRATYAAIFGVPAALTGDTDNDGDFDFDDIPAFVQLLGGDQQRASRVALPRSATAAPSTKASAGARRPKLPASLASRSVASIAGTSNGDRRADLGEHPARWSVDRSWAGRVDHVLSAWGPKQATQ